MKVAIQGCLHGQLEEVYYQLTLMESKLEIKLDLLIICGDFQSIRHEQDLDDMHCPIKYKAMGCFRNYYQGIKVAPVLTVLIGGNHEAVNSLRESHFGGWLAPKIYFLGQVGSILVRKGKEMIRISGGSGIYKANDFKYTTRVQRYPLRGKDRITAYHTKQIDLFRLQLLARISIMQKQKPQLYGDSYNKFDIVLSHDWPKDIAVYGDLQQLYKYKPFLRDQIDNGTFGSGPMLRFLQVAKPSYWFSAHMHVKYASLYPHKQKEFTHFLSLDKCLGKRSCLQLLDFYSNSKNQQPISEVISEQVTIEVDSTWIGVLLLTKELMQGNDQLYFLEKESVKLVDKDRMNQLILLYPSVRESVAKIGRYSFDSKMSQTQQTGHFLDSIGLDRKYLEGICLQRQQFKFQQPQNDEIELDL